MPSRRQFLVGAGVLGAAAFGGAFVFRHKLAAVRRGYGLTRQAEGVPGAAVSLPAAKGMSRVVQVVHPGVFGSGTRPEAQEVEAMVDRAMRAAFDVPKAQDAWRALFPDPKETVGIKVNTAAGRAGPNTSPELVRALVRGLEMAGIERERIYVFDRFHEELIEAGFTMSPDGPGVRVIATNSLFRSTQFVSYGLTVKGEPVRVSQIVRLCSAIINCAVVKDHNQAGYTGTLKNWYGVIDRPSRFHEALSRAQFIPEIANLRPLRSRVRLGVVEALRAQCERGPHGAREWHFLPRAILVGTDQVALDTLGVLMVEEERRRRGLPSLEESGRKPEYLTVAARLGLGTNELARIERVVQEV